MSALCVLLCCNTEAHSHMSTKNSAQSSLLYINTGGCSKSLRCGFTSAEFSRWPRRLLSIKSLFMISGGQRGISIDCKSLSLQSCFYLKEKRERKRQADSGCTRMILHNHRIEQEVLAETTKRELNDFLRLFGPFFFFMKSYFSEVKALLWYRDDKRIITW